MTGSQVKSDHSAAAGAANGFNQAQKQAQSIFATQKELLDSLQQMNEHWFARAKSEAELATALANKLAAARSVPDVTDVYKDWLTHRIERYVEDSGHVLLDVQKFVQAGTRLMQNGSTGAA